MQPSFQRKKADKLLGLCGCKIKFYQPIHLVLESTNAEFIFRTLLFARHAGAMFLLRTCCLGLQVCSFVATNVFCVIKGSKL